MSLNTGNTVTAPQKPQGFQKGNKHGKGRPHASKVNKLKSAFLDVVTDEDVRDVVKAVVKEAKAGDIDAAKVFLDRVFGKAIQPITHEGGTDSRLQVEVTYRMPDKPTFPRVDTAN